MLSDEIDAEATEENATSRPDESVEAAVAR